jgi:hypothetical protein
MIQKINWNNVLGKLLQKFHEDKCYKMVIWGNYYKNVCVTIKFQNYFLYIEVYIISY